MATAQEEIKKRIAAQQARKAMPPQKKVTVTDVESGLATTGPKDLVMPALRKRDSEVVGYTPKKPRQMVPGGTFGYAGPSFKAPASPESPGEPEWLTKENAPTMGWQQRTAINRELAANYRERLRNITNLEQAGIVTKAGLEERRMQETGLGTRQKALFGHESGMQAGRQAFVTGEREATQKFTTGEREATELFKTDEADKAARRKFGSEIYLASGDPTTAENVYNSTFGNVDLGEIPIPKKNEKNPYKWIKGRSETIYGPGGVQTKEYPDVIFDEATSQFAPVVNYGATNVTPGQVVDLQNMSTSELQALKKKKEIEQAMREAEEYQ